MEAVQRVLRAGSCIFSVAVSLVLMVNMVTPALAGADEKPIWLVVTRPVFQESIKPLAKKRREDGFRTVISTRSVADAISALKHRPVFVLLVGDDQSGGEKQPWYVPSRRRKLYRWRTAQRKEFASDALWGDFDGDLIPDAPVGRIPVRTVSQLKLVVDKILAFENKQPTPDDLRLPMWLGSPGYNPVIDSMTTGLLLSIARTKSPAWARLWIISADASHPLCGRPSDQAAMFTKQLKRGGIMAALMGHASATSFYSMKFEGRSIRYTAADAENALATGKPGPVLAILSCDSGNFAGRRNCLAESLLMMKGGPVAVIGATTESHPLTNYFSGLCLLQALGGNDKRIGSLWLAAQQRAMKVRNPVIEWTLRDVEGKLEKKINVAKLRRDQILMYALLGDPAARMHLPDPLDCKIKRHGDGWHWQVHKPKGATRLYVGFRQAGRSSLKVASKPDRSAARRRFQQANATFAFETVSELADSAPWKGAINKEGVLRMVATGPGRIYVAAFRLKVADRKTTTTKPGIKSLNPSERPLQ